MQRCIILTNKLWIALLSDLLHFGLKNFLTKIEWKHWNGLVTLQGIVTLTLSEAVANAS